MLNHTVAMTNKFLEKMPKSKRKNKGQFFTSIQTAKFMVDMFDLSNIPVEVCILDPGAGTGILTAAFMERLQEIPRVQKINLVCYETDEDVLDVLRDNLIYIASHTDKSFVYEIRSEDYILSQQDDFNGTMFSDENMRKYDFIIGNPPYLRIMRNHAAAMAMSSIVHGAPNLYFLFASMSLFNLKPEGELVYIIPRSWTSGAYFTAFRRYFLEAGTLEQIHIFVSRDKVFSEDQVLQETIIIKCRKTKEKPHNVLITSSYGNTVLNEAAKIHVAYSSIVRGEALYVYLPTCEDEIAVLDRINIYKNTFQEEGIRMRTGIVVDFRQWKDLRGEPGEHNLPLFYSQHIQNGRVHHSPSGKAFDWIVDAKKGLVQKNQNYVFCKRFTAKEEKRRLQCGIYNPKEFEQYQFIATQNKINYVERVDGVEMDLNTTYGVYALLNSSLFDRYYRILNGSTQVNSTEINRIPVPPMDLIMQIGEQLRETGDLSTESCDRIVMEIAYA